MACFHPLEAWYCVDGEDRGKIFFYRMPGKMYLACPLPCGKCVGCRMEQARQWAIRCLHEAELHKDNCMITLTYNDGNLPSDGSLCPRDLQLWLKKLRKALEPVKIRFFAAGEYGEKMSRPHYHIILFGIDFKDEIAYNKNDDRPEIEVLRRTWEKGYVSVLPLTYESAAYVARYCLKKQQQDLEYTDRTTGVVREREFTRMSRRPGIGAGWFDVNSSDTYKDDTVIYGRGLRTRPPRYYDRRYESTYGSEALSEIKRKRIEEAVSKSANRTMGKLLARERNMKARLNLKRRKIEC